MFYPAQRSTVCGGFNVMSEESVDCCDGYEERAVHGGLNWRVEADREREQERERVCVCEYINANELDHIIVASQRVDLLVALDYVIHRLPPNPLDHPYRFFYISLSLRTTTHYGRHH
jgi:hypothetical protein